MSKVLLSTDPLKIFTIDEDDWIEKQRVGKADEGKKQQLGTYNSLYILHTVHASDCKQTGLDMEKPQLFTARPTVGTVSPR